MRRLDQLRGSRYEITALGRAMVEEFAEYRETVRGIQHFGTAIEALPEPAQSLDFRHLRDADITLRTDDEPFACFDRGLHLIRRTDTCRWLASGAPIEYMRGIRDGVEERGVTAGGVISTGIAETLREDPERAEPWRAFADQVWVYDGHVPLSMEIVDETVLVWLYPKGDDRWDGTALLESDHPAVRSWVNRCTRSTVARRIDSIRRYSPTTDSVCRDCLPALHRPALTEHRY